MDDSKNILALVKHPNKFSVMILAICLAAIFLAALVVVLIRRFIHKLKTRQGDF